MRRLLLSLALALPFFGCDTKQPDPEPNAGEPEQPGPAPCTYPEATDLVGVGSIMPRVSWSDAYLPEGATVDFDLEDVYCQEGAWAGTKTIFFVIVAEWCPNCPDYLRGLAPLSRQIGEAGGLIVVVDLETRSYALPTNESAHNYVSGYIGSQAALRVGEADADPVGTIYNSSIWSAVPGTFVVRTSDMKVIANQEDTPYILPFVQIAQHPDADWSNPADPPFFTSCGPDDEEALEPNDTPAQAAPLEPGTYQGGICADAPDYYEVGLQGAWRLDLGFSNSVGDLDVYVVDPTSGEPLVENGQRVGSESSTDDESFEYSGPAIIKVVGFQKASAPYTLTLSSL